MKYTVRFTGIALAFLGIVAMCGCKPQNVGADGFPPPQPEPAAAKAAASAMMLHAGARPSQPSNAQPIKTQ
jgi:hypothetical protein